MIRYVAIYKKRNGDTFVIEYRPAYDECAGAIEILSIEAKHHPANWQEQRAQYQRTPTRRRPRQLELGMDDDTRREQ